jgi:hypothetical protein
MSVIRLLNTSFVATWVLKVQLPSLREGTVADTRRLATAVMGARQKSSPVDCIVLSTDAALVAAAPVQDLLDTDHRGASERYLAFLEEALGKVKK